MTRAIHTRVTCPAPPSRIWALLTDPAAATWNPRLRLAAAPVAGVRVPMRVKLFGVWLWVRIRVEVARADEELAWTGGPSGLFVGRHTFRLTPTADGQGTLLDHGEDFEGRLVSLLWPLLERELASLYDDVNRALVLVVEARTGGAAGSA